MVQVDGIWLRKLLSKEQSTPLHCYALRFFVKYKIKPSELANSINDNMNNDFSVLWQNCISVSTVADYIKFLWIVRVVSAFLETSQ